MSEVGQREAHTQRRVVKFFRDALGYTYLGDWRDQPRNASVEKGLLTDFLKHRGHNGNIVNKALHELSKAAALGGSRTLYDANREVYDLLRYGLKVQPAKGKQHITVWLIDWANPSANQFAIAEEVTIAGKSAKRPDLVLYVNGIAFGVLELKRSTVSVAEGIRQNLDSQKKEFIRPFFTTVQLLMAGNETEGLRYGLIGTPEKHWLRWKEEDTHPKAGDNPLLQEIGQLCSKERLLEIVHDFMVFDAGAKKTCRHNQYFGVRAAQECVKRREGGILWHTQGSGKSLTMVWLAKWIRENVTNGRVLIVTDRTELDEQIEQVFKGVSEKIHRTQNAADLVQALGTGQEWLMCSLIQKFGKADEGDIDNFLQDILAHLPKGFQAKGELFVFVDECHRTQSGKLHRAMQQLLPNALLIGFTGTPLLKSDKQRSIEIFGPYIHTYKYDEAVQDKVVLDLRYEARDIDQELTSQAKVDQWFDLKTQGLTDIAKAQLRQRWGTLRKVLSSRDRLAKIMGDILIDMETRDRLKSGRGNALLVMDSIHSACRIFEMFQRTDLNDKCAIVTSYRPATSDIKGEDAGEGQTEKLRQYEVYRKMLAAHFNESEDRAMHKADRFEQEVKRRFIEEPRRMKLLIVVDKLLTGFDAPPATYLYIDKPMRDHGLFQAICRVNRLHGEDKEYGCVIDYKDLFKSLERSIQDYTGEVFEGYDAADVQGLLKNRLKQGREQLEEVREKIKALCEPVAPPRDTAAHLRYFCTVDGKDAAQRKADEHKRLTLYRLTAAYLRAYANLANEMREAGYSEREAEAVKKEVSHFEKVRQEVKMTSGDYIDLKMYEPAMRHLLDTYIRAEESEKLSAFDDLTLVQLIVEQGEKAFDSLPKGIRGNQEALAETIENNVRRLIIDEQAVNPKYYEQMGKLLDDLIKKRKQEAVEYKEYLAQIIRLTKQIENPEEERYPLPINSPARRALYDCLREVPQLERLLPISGVAETADLAAATALAVDDAVCAARMADWRGHRIKERKVRNAIRNLISDDELTDEIFAIVKAQQSRD